MESEIKWFCNEKGYGVIEYKKNGEVIIQFVDNLNCKTVTTINEKPLEFNKKINKRPA